MASQTPAVLPMGIPVWRASSIHPGVHCSLQVLVPCPLCIPWHSQRWDGRPQLSVLRWPPCSLINQVVATVAATPSSFPSPPHALSPIVLFLHQGLSRERPLSCREVVTAAHCPALALALPFTSGTSARAGWARSCHVPCSFLWWLMDTGQ